MATSPNYITPDGFKRLKDELHHLLYTERPEIVRTVAWAASNGDRSENGDYIYGKRRMREIDRRIRFLTKRLESAHVVDPKSRPKDGTAGGTGERILFGATVTLENEDGQTKIYQIVGTDELDPANGKISWISPLAKALLNRCEGDVVTFRSPGGEQELEILKIEYR